MSRMFDRMDREEIAVGTIMLAPGREYVEVIGYAGLDFVCLDMMVTPLDWSEAASMVTSAALHGVTPWLRLSAYPWANEEFDASLSAQVLRGLSIGAECVLASVNTAREVEAMLHPLSNPHRRYYLARGAGRTDDQERFDAAEAPQQVIPIIESEGALNNVDEILAVDGVRYVYLGMGDLTRALGHPGDDRHPEVRDAVASIVAKARDRGIRVCANMLANVPGIDISEQIVASIQALRELGVSAAMTPRPTMVLQRFYEATLRQVR